MLRSIVALVCSAPLLVPHSRCAPVIAAARWDAGTDADLARSLEIEPLDAANAALLDAVHPRGWQDPEPPDVYDLLVIGAGAGGLVSAKQAARRGARSCMISEQLAGGDCLNVGCVPSKVCANRIPSPNPSPNPNPNPFRNPNLNPKSESRTPHANPEPES